MDFETLEYIVWGNVPRGYTQNYIVLSMKDVNNDHTSLNGKMGFLPCPLRLIENFIYC